MDLDEIKELDTRERLERHWFPNNTTYSNDFRYISYRSPIKTGYRERDYGVFEGKRPSRPCRKRNEQGFELMVEPKELFDAAGRLVNDKYEPEAARREAQRTRPRVTLSPAVPIDDMDESVRRELIRDTYQSDVTRAQRSVRFMLAPSPSREELIALSPANPISLEPLRPPCVAPEWREESMTWDAQQKGQRVATTPFWPKKMGRCEVCRATAARHKEFRTAQSQCALALEVTPAH